MTLPEYLASLKALSEKATERPWRSYMEGADLALEERTWWIDGPKNSLFLTAGNPHREKEHDAAYTVAACNAVPRLIEIVMAQAEVIKLWHIAANNRLGEKWPECWRAAYDAESTLAALIEGLEI